MENNNNELLNLIQQSKAQANSEGVIEQQVEYVEDYSQVNAYKQNRKRNLIAWGILSFFFWAFFIPVIVFLIKFHKYVKTFYGGYGAFFNTLTLKSYLKVAAIIVGVFIATSLITTVLGGLMMLLQFGFINAGS
jgi:fatty acid desaturase